MRTFLALVALTAFDGLALGEFETLTAKTGNAGTAKAGAASVDNPAAGTSNTPAASPTSSPARSSQPENVPGPTVQSSLIDIKVETSRPQPTVGILGISARITNISNSTIYIKAKDMNLVLPPELEVWQV